jgi:hypothetical protein
LILLTGSHAFYNWLSLAIFIGLLDDLALPSWAWRFMGPAPSAPMAKRPAWQTGALATAAAGLVAWSSLASWMGLTRQGPLGWSRRIVECLRPLYLASSYGAFGHMTRDRREIVIEGSDDGVNWKEYGMAYKPGEPMRAPVVAAPHHPRLDWQLWFVPLGQPAPWLAAVRDGLLENRPAITAFFPQNPFPDKPPGSIRFVLYDYEFTTPEEGRRTGAWWKRRLIQATPPYP